MTLTAEALADSNLVASVVAHARWQTPCEWDDSGGVLRVAGANGLPIPFRNCILRTDSHLAPEQVLSSAREYFGPRGRGFAVMLRDSCDADLDAYLREQGLTPGLDAPCMLVEAPLAGPSELPGIVVERIRDVRHQADAVAVSAEAYEALKLPAAETRLYFSKPDALLDPAVEGFVAYRNGVPLATAFALINGEAAGVYWVGTVAAARGAGLGELCTRLATNAGFARGARVVTLQASPFGEPIYRRMGYRVYDQYRRYLCPLPA